MNRLTRTRKLAAFCRTDRLMIEGMQTLRRDTFSRCNRHQRNGWLRDRNEILKGRKVGQLNKPEPDAGASIGGRTGQRKVARSDAEWEHIESQVLSRRSVARRIIWKVHALVRVGSVAIPAPFSLCQHSRPSQPLSLLPGRPESPDRHPFARPPACVRHAFCAVKLAKTTCKHRPIDAFLRQIAGTPPLARPVSATS